MHAHHKNLLRNFWLISPGKTPTGKTSQRGEILIIFFSNVQDRKNSGKIQLISTGKLLHKVWKNNAQQNSQHPFSFSVPNQQYQTVLFLGNRATVRTAPAGRTLPRFLCNLSADRTALTQPYLPRILCKK